MNKKPKAQPPNWAVNFLYWFCPPELIEGILGDIIENYQSDLEQYRPGRAKQRFIWNVLQFFHPSIFLRNHLTLKIINMGMLKSHLLVAFRSMHKYKFYSIINIAGLSTAIAFIFLSFLFIKSELNINQFHTKKNSVWRVYHKIVNLESGVERNLSAVTAIPLSKDLKEELPIIGNFSRHGSSTVTIRKEEKAFSELATFVDEGFLTMFDFPLLNGDRHTALNTPNNIIISEEKAKIYFGETNPIGQSLAVDFNDSTLNLLITGVIDNKSEQSSLQFDFLLPFDQYSLLVSEQAFKSYNYGLVENYVQIESNQNKKEIEAQLTQAIQKYSEPDEERLELGLQSLVNMHFEDKIIGNAAFTSPKKIYIMITLALLVLIIAGINFINLSTSHALSRFKEIGLRKTLGALKRQIRGQLIAESIFVSLFACIIGLIIASLLLPGFSKLVETTLPFSLDLISFLFLISVSLIIGLITGISQAIILVKQNTNQALKGNFKLSGSSSWFNQSLIVLQFSLSILLIIGAVHIHQQMQFIMNKDLGFDKERLLEISITDTPDLLATQQIVNRFKEKALQDDQVVEVSASMNNAREPWTELIFEQEDGSKEAIYYNQIDPDYLKTMDIQLLSGENFRPDANKEELTILVNESLVKHFSWETIEGKQIPGRYFTQSHRIAGVFKDFHFSTLHNKISPLILALDAKSIDSGISGLSTYIWPPNLYQIVVRLGPGEIKPAITRLQEIWKNQNPDRAFDYCFVDEVLEKRYTEETRWKKIVSTGSIFAIAVAWLGLLGLMRLSIQKRTKEIGIRKVLGATISGIILMLSRRFIILVLIGNLIAWPIGWWLSHQWLESFNYRISLNPLWFFWIGLAVILLSLLSISLQSLQAAKYNPVKSLKVE